MNAAVRQQRDARRACRPGSIAPKSMHQTRPPSARSSSKKQHGPRGQPGAGAAAGAPCAFPGPRRAVTASVQPPLPRDFSPTGGGLHRRLWPYSRPAASGRAAAARPPAAARFKKRCGPGPVTEKRRVSAAQNCSLHSCGTSHLLRSSIRANRPASDQSFAREGFYPQVPRHTMLPGCPPCPDRCAAA